MKAKVYKTICLIVALIVAVFTVGYAFAWYLDHKDSKFILSGASAGAYFDSGNGTKETPFVIANSTHMRNLAVLQNMGRFVDENGNPKIYYFEIKKTIDELDMGVGLWLPPIGNDEAPFIGVFNGNGKSIKNLKVTTDKTLLKVENYPIEASPSYQFSNAVGLFGNTGESSEIRNFILDNPVLLVGSTSNTSYSTGAAKVVGLAVGHVEGKCQSIGVRATKTGDTSLQIVDAGTGYSTFNSILGELGQGVESSVTGGGHTAGSGGSGNQFGSSFDVDGMYDRLVKIEANKKSATPAWRLPNLGDSSKESITLNNLEKLPFTVDGALSTYVGADAREILAGNNIGYLLGNQNKVYAKTVKFGDPITQVTNGSYQYGDGTNPSTNKVIPRWFYKTNSTYIGSDTYSTSNMRALTETEFAALPQGIKDILPASNGQVEGFGSVRISQSYSNVGVQVYAESASGNQWSPHGQISWMGNTYGLGFTMTDYKGNAVDENGNLYTANGNLMGADGYEVDENGVYAVDSDSYPDFPYVVYQVGTVWPDQSVAFDADGNRYYRYDPGKSGLYVYGVLKNGYLMTGDNCRYYVAPIAGWDKPIALIDSDGYAMYAPGIYFDASGNIVDGAYVKDVNGLYIASDPAFNMPISNIVGGYAQDADGNYYGVITLNGNPVYCYLGANGKTSGYSGWYMSDGNYFLVPATNIDANGNVKYNETDYYGTYNGQKGYVDANGYFYDSNHAYVVTDGNLMHTVYLADADGYAMADANKYYGKLQAAYSTEYAYVIKRKDKFYWLTMDDSYHVADSNFYGTVKFIDDDGYAMASEDVYYGRFQVNSQYVYGELDVRNGISYLKVDGKYIAEDGNSYEFMDDNGHFKYDADSEFYYGKRNTWDNFFTPLNKDGCVYDETLDAKGVAKGYSLNSGYFWWITNQGYSLCEDEDSENYGYFVNGSGNVFTNYFTGNTPLKAWGYTSDEISAIFSAGKIGLNESNWHDSTVFVTRGTLLEAATGAEKFTVQEGEPISVEEGEIDKAISGEDINGLEGQFITPKEIEKIKVVTETVSADDKLEKVTVKTASPVTLYNFKSGVVLPNNGIWFKPSIAGKIRLVMYAENAGDGFSLIQGHRTSATKEDPFAIDYTKAGSDITVKEIAKCGLPSRVLFYFEYDISEEEIADGRYEYWILQNDGGNGKDPGGAYFVYLDLGAAAAEDTSAVVPDKVSAVDFIYAGVEISQEDVADTDIKIGDFIVNASGTVVRYDSSKTSVYFENLANALKIVYVRLHNDTANNHSGKTICLEGSVPTLNTGSEVHATFAAYVCPTISGGSGTVGGGGGTVTPNPGPDNPDDVAVTSVSISGAPATMTVGGTATLSATVSPNNATDKTVTWSTSNGSIATVADGVVTAKAAGTVTITATANDGSGKSDSVTITVEAGAVSGTIYPAKGTYSVVGDNLSKSLTLANDGIEFSNNSFDTSSNATWTGTINGNSVEFETCMRAGGNNGRYIAINVKAGTKISVAFGGNYSTNNASASMWIGSTSSTAQASALASETTTNVGKTDASGLLEYEVATDGTYYIIFDTTKPIIFAIVLS